MVKKVSLEEYIKYMCFTIKLHYKMHDQDDYSLIESGPKHLRYLFFFECVMLVELPPLFVRNY